MINRGRRTAGATYARPRGPCRRVRCTHRHGAAAPAAGGAWRPAATRSGMRTPSMSMKISGRMAPAGTPEPYLGRQGPDVLHFQHGDAPERAGRGMFAP